MLLYELTSPAEHKYGGCLTEEQLLRCTRQTQLDSPRWTPYATRTPHVENICGKFVVRVAGSTATGRGGGLAGGGTSSASGGGGSGIGDGSGFSSPRLPPRNSTGGVEPVEELPVYTSCLNDQRTTIDHGLSSVCFRTDSPFGRQQEMFHLDGHITVWSTPGLTKSMIFKGAKGAGSVANLMRDLFLDAHQTVPLVHMGVISSCMGMRLQTSQCCYLENRVLEGFGAMNGNWMAVEARTPDQCNIVRLSVTNWTSMLPAHLIPASNDIVITGKGSVVHRFSWAGLAWDAAVEQLLLGACERVVAAIMSVC